MRRIVVSIYIDPDFYPPTINAILNLSEKCDELIVVSRNNSKTDYPFPPNVKLVKTGKYISVRDTEVKGLGYKVLSFFQFTFSLLKYARPGKTGLIILYDSIPLFSYHLIKHFIQRKGKVIWYHNHDMPNIKLTRKFSVGWWAAKYEHLAMRSLQFFSLPSNDRVIYYPDWNQNNNYFCIPNYPSLKVYNEPVSKIENLNELRVIFQGSIGEGHALEEMIELLQETIEGKRLQLILKGSVRNEYKEKLDKLADTFNVADQLTWIGLGPYKELPAITSSCHIGIAIHKENDEVMKTLGTASNKIYEYAASGLPVILYDSNQFKKYLSNYTWAFFSDTSKESLRSNIKMIIANYPAISKDARDTFKKELNFENYFQPVINTVMKSVVGN